MRIKIIRNNSGFTLLEVILVLVFISIFATIAVLRQPVPEVTIRSASQVLISHIRYAQMRAMNSAEPWGVRYSDTSGTYWLFRENIANRQVFPGATEDDIDLSADSVSITQGDFTLSFDNWGVPDIADAGFTFSDGQATLTLSTGTQSGDVTVIENTGYAR